MLRKAGKLPGECESISYNLEYGSNTFEIQKSAIKI
jgi:adenine phosphoribosyltransferase